MANFQTIILNLCDAAMRRDASLVADTLKADKTLKCNTIDMDLTQPSTICQEILQQLCSDAPIANGTAEDVLRALLMIAPAHETPWRAIVVLLECLHANSGWLGSSPNALFVGTTHVQSFLQETISAWWRLENVSAGNPSGGGVSTSSTTTITTPRHWLLRIAQVAMRPLHDDSVGDTNGSDNRHWVLPLDIITTIVRFCQELEGSKSTTSNSVLDELFSEHMVKSRMLPLLSLAYDLKSQLSDNHLKRLHSLLTLALSSNQIPSCDLPGIARSIVSFSDKDQEWKLLLLDVLHTASKDLQAYSTVETVIQASLSSQTTHSLFDWFSIKQTKSIPKWILANYRLLLFQAARQSGSQCISRLLSLALGKDDKVYNILELCCESLVDLCFPSALFFRKRCNISSFQRVMTGVNYRGEGIFNRGDKVVEGWDLGLLCQSLYLGSNKLEYRIQQLSATDRAQGWIHAATSLLAQDSFVSKLTAILVVVTVFCEVPASRSTLVRSMVGDGKSLTDMDCVILGVLTRSITKQIDLESLEPVCNHYASKLLHVDIFKQLTGVLACIGSGRRAILSTCQKNLQSFNAPWWALSENRQGSNAKESIEAALYGLCVLLIEWDDLGQQAWKMLSDYLVLNKPSLPVTARSCLYQLLLTLIKQGRYSCSVLEHIFRAVLVRLLTYFDYRGEQLVFAPQRAYVSFASSSETLAKEDFGLLFEVAVEVLISLVPKGEESYSLEENLSKLQSISAAVEVSVTFSLGATIHIPFYNGLLASLLASACLLDPGTTTSETKSLYVSLDYDFHTAAKVLIEEERKSLFGSGRIDKNSVPSWVSEPSYQCLNTGDASPGRSVYVSILDQTIRLLGWCSSHHNSKGQLNLVVSMSKLYAKRDKFVSTDLKKVTSVSFSTHAQAMIHPSTLLCFTESIPRMLEDEMTNFEDLALVLSALKAALLNVSLSARCHLQGKGHLDEMFALLGAVSALHRHIGNELCFVFLLRFMEKKRAPNQVTKNHSDAILAIQNASDADIVVRDLRSTILCSLADCIEAILNGGGCEFHPYSGSLHNSQQFDIASVAPLTLSSEILESVAVQLCQGLNGLSGGIDNKLFDLHLRIIEVVVKMSHSLVPATLETQMILDSAKATSRRINEILCKYEICSAPLFRRAVNIAIVVLPSLVKVSLKSLYNSESQANMPDFTFLEKLSDQTLEVADVMACGKEYKWTYSISKEIDNGGLESKEESNDGSGIPAEISVLKEIVPSQALSSKAAVKLTSKTSWADSLKAVLTACENALCEAATPSHMKKIVSVDSALDELSDYTSWRHRVLSICIRTVCRCLETSSDGNQKLIAEVIPSPSKVKLLHILDRLLVLMVKAVRLLTTYIDKGGLSSLRILEILPFASAWVFGAEDDSNIIGCTRVWFRVEKQNLMSSQASKGEVSKTFAKLTKIMFRADELKDVLQKLTSGKTSWHKKESLQYKRFKLVENAMRRAVRENGTREEISLLKALERQLHYAKLSRSEGCDYIGVLPNARKRKRQQIVAQRMRQERRRPIPRSRNRVVDQWQQLDVQDKNMDSGGLHDETNDEDDAYVDLEDFIVDG